MKRALLSLAALATVSAASAAGLDRIRFVVVDPSTGRPTDGFVHVSEPNGRSTLLSASAWRDGRTAAVDGRTLMPALGEATTITLPVGASVTLTQQDPLPTKEIVIRVTATRLAPAKTPGSATGTVRDRDELKVFSGPGSQDAKALTKGQAGVAEDSGGQAHVRGEHGEISYVVDGVPLPDTLSGRQGSVVVSSTIQSLEIITGGFAPEFGGQTAAVLNVTTLGRVSRARNEFSLFGGSYDALSGGVTSVGPLGRKASYVIDLNGSRTRNFQEPQQPDGQDAHNAGTEESAFVRFHLTPSSKEALSVTFSTNPAAIEIPNRTGLPGEYRDRGQGYGLFGLRNADGTRPDGAPGVLGSETLLLPNQETAGQDIRERDITEFTTLAYNRRLGRTAEGQLALTLLHSGQDVTNRNPAVDLANLPVDSSIEFNPEAYRNVHHVQLTGYVGETRGRHRLKAGFLYDDQSGTETYRLTPGSQLALDALAATAPGLAPSGTTSAELDVNGNPVFTPTGGAPALRIDRKGYYGALYAQDTWGLGRFTVNYGLRGDWYGQRLNGGASVDTFELSPRLNLSYNLDRRTEAHLAYGHLLNTPPIAQGALLGQVIQPEIIDQYDASLAHHLGRGQTVSLAYYYKQIKNQFDTALLIPGSQIGIYNTVSLERGGVHGVELGYELSSPGTSGWDGFLNYSYSAAKPNGVDNTGEEVEEFNDHDQTHTLGLGLAYRWRSGATAALTLQYGSGLASSIVPPNIGRTPRSQVDLKLGTGNRLFGGRAGLSLDIENLFDSREVINFQSDFSGTRFQQGRRITLGLSGSF